LTSLVQQSQHSAGSVGSERRVNLPLAVDQFKPLSLHDGRTLGGKGDQAQESKDRCKAGHRLEEALPALEVPEARKQVTGIKVALGHGRLQGKMGLA
jgi:hypothetical protein